MIHRHPEKGSSWWRCDYHLARVIIIIMLGRGRCCADLPCWGTYQSTTKWTGHAERRGLLDRRTTVSRAGLFH
jgi:hypothetical protein